MRPSSVELIKKCRKPSKKKNGLGNTKNQLKEFFGKSSGWYVSQRAGNIKLEVRVNGKKESRTLPYKLSKSGFAVAVEEIKQIYKRFNTGESKSLAEAYDKNQCIKFNY